MSCLRMNRQTKANEILRFSRRTFICVVCGSVLFVREEPSIVCHLCKARHIRPEAGFLNRMVTK
jgi:rubrerythrin